MEQAGFSTIRTTLGLRSFIGVEVPEVLQGGNHDAIRLVAKDAWHFVKLLKTGLIFWRRAASEQAGSKAAGQRLWLRSEPRNASEAP